MCKQWFKYVFLLICPFASAYGQTTNEPFFLLLNAEKEFLWTVQEEGLRKGYLRFLDKESIIFTREGVRAGRKHYRQSDTDSSALLRNPERADITDDGLLGYTLGSFEYRRDVKNNQADRTGHYLTLWKRKNSNDDWQIVLDIAVPHATGKHFPQADPYKKQIANKVPITAAHEVLKAKEVLMNTDELLNISLQAGRHEFAHKEFYNDSVLVLREDIAPETGWTASVERMDKLDGRYTYESTDGFLTPTRNFSYTFGTAFYYENIDTVRYSQWYHYVRVWQKDQSGAWPVVVDVAKAFDK